MEVGMVAAPLMQIGLVFPKARQFPQYVPEVQSVGLEHASKTWQVPSEQEMEMWMKEKRRRRRRNLIDGALSKV